MHIDLFTGIGGFTLACHWNGIQTEVMCEKDEKCRQFLERTWPRIPIVHDIRDFNGTKWRGRFLLTGGVPCQPASRAGKQRGKADDRWLWPEAIRVVGEALPAWCLFENPPGIYDVGIDGILSDLEGIGYETGIVEIPACAINAPQIRQRVWIVGHSESSSSPTIASIRSGAGIDTERGTSDMAKSSSPRTGDNTETINDKGGGAVDTGAESLRCRDRETSSDGITPASQGDLADTSRTECFQGGHDKPRNEERSYSEFAGDITNQAQWDNSLWLPCADGKLRRAPDDSFGLVDGLHRSLLAALGNSIVPEVAYEIIKAIKMVEDKREG